jgi:hypothetical protein
MKTKKMKTKKITVTVETAFKLLKTPVPVLAKRPGIGHKTIMALCEEYRRIILARAEVSYE